MHHKSCWSQDVMTLVCLWISLDYANGAVGCSKTSLSPQQLLYLGILRLEGPAVALWCRGVIESDRGGGAGGRGVQWLQFFFVCFFRGSAGMQLTSTGCNCAKISFKDMSDEKKRSKN